MSSSNGNAGERRRTGLPLQAASRVTGLMSSVMDLHVRIALLSGRTAEQRQALAAAVLAAVQQTLTVPPGVAVQLSAETVDLDRPSYAKAVVHGG